MVLMVLKHPKATLMSINFRDACVRTCVRTCVRIHLWLRRSADSVRGEGQRWFVMYRWKR